VHQRVAGDRDQDPAAGLRLDPGDDDDVGPLAADQPGVAEAALVIRVVDEGPGVGAEEQDVDGAGKGVGEVDLYRLGLGDLLLEQDASAAEADGGGRAREHERQGQAPEEDAAGRRSGGGRVRAHWEVNSTAAYPVTPTQAPAPPGPISGPGSWPGR